MTENEKLKKILTDAMSEALSKNTEANDSQFRAEIVKTIGADIVSGLMPLLQELVANKDEMVQEIKTALQEVNIEVPGPVINLPAINVPAIKMPEFPKIPAPVVNYTPPNIKIPDFPQEMEISGWVNMMGFDKGFYTNPLPVQLRDAKGNPIKLMEMLAAIADSKGNGSGSMGSGKTDYFTLKAILDSSGNPYSSTNPIPVTITSGGSATSASALVDSAGAQYSGSNPLPVTIASGGTATSASNIVDSSGVAYSGSNPIPSYQASQPTFTAAVVLEDSGGAQYSGSNPIPSYQVNQPTFTTAVVLEDSAGVQYSGSNPIPVVIATGSNNTVGAANVDSSGAQYSGSNPVPTYQATQPTFTAAVVLEDSGGAQYSGSNPIPVTMISSSVNSTVSTGPTTVGGTDDGSAPVQMGGIVRSTNPTKLADNQVSKATLDVIGRQVMRPIQVRGLIQTAYVQFTTGTETTLRAGVAGAFLDLIYIMASNNSDAAVSVDIRQVTSGGVIMTLSVPANGVAGVSLPVPIPQQDTGNNWTADLPDITGTTVSISALFSQEV